MMTTEPTKPKQAGSIVLREPFASSKGCTGTAHGKLIIVGEHSVVYGHPAVAAPFQDMTVTTTVEQTEGPGAIDCQLFQGPLTSLPDGLRGLGLCIVETLNRLGHATAHHVIRIHSLIPPSRGLGSSAAVAVSVVRSLYAYYGEALCQPSLVELVNIAERSAHGNPSGIDLAAVTSDNPLWFQKGRPSERLDVAGQFHFVVADSGHAKDTGAAVAAVRAALESDSTKLHRHMARLSQIAYAAREAIRVHHPRGLGVVLDAAQAELEQIGVSNSVLNNLVAAARNAGALGAKLTGSGCGGCVLALASTQQHAKALATALCAAGATRCWELTIGHREQTQGGL